MKFDKEELMNRFSEMIDEYCNEEEEEVAVVDCYSMDEMVINIVKSSEMPIDFINQIRFHVGDYINVPTKDGDSIRFDVKHIQNGKVYFVSHDIVGKSKMTDIDEFLNNALSKMPSELVDLMCEIEHIGADGEYTTRRRLTIPSYGNLFGGDDCTGADDMWFDGFKTEADRCKNYGSETSWYWTDTRSANISTSVRSVYNYGGENNNYADNSYGVVLGFCIQSE